MRGTIVNSTAYFLAAVVAAVALIMGFIVWLVIDDKTKLDVFVRKLERK